MSATAAPGACFIVVLALSCLGWSPDDALDEARQARRAGRLDEAVAMLREALDQGSGDAECAGLLALCLLDQGDTAAAEAVLARAGTDGYRLGVAAGRLELLRGEHEAAIARLQQVVERDPRPVEALVALLTALEAESRWVAAASWAETLEQHVPALGRRWGARMHEAVGDRILGRAARNVEALPRVADAYAAAWAKDPTLPALGAKLLEADINAHRIERALALLPVVYPEHERPLEHHVARGRVAAVARDFPAAELAFGLVLARAPGHRDASLESARLQLAAGQPQAALAVLEPLGDEWPWDAEVELQRGLALVQLRDFAGAELRLRRTVEQQPDHVEALYQLGRSLVVQRRVEEGRVFIERSKRALRDLGDQEG